MTIQISAGYWSDSARTKGEIKTAGENLISIVKEIPGGTGETSATLSSNSFTPLNNYAIYNLETESSAASDVLDHIATTNVRNGQIIGIRLVNSSHVISIDHGAGGAGQILTPDGFDIDLNDTKQIVFLKYNSSNTSWEVLDLPTNVVLFPPGGSSAAKVMASHPTSAGTRPILRDLAKEHLNTIMDTTVGWKDVTNTTVSTNTITPTRAIHTIDTSSSAQTVNTINTANMTAGRVLFLSPSSNNNPLTLGHQVGSAGTGRITIRGAANLTLSTVDQGIWLVQVGGDWREIDRCGFSSSGAVQGIVQGRLTAVTGSALADSAGGVSSTLYFTPHNGNQVATHNGTTWTVNTFSEKSLSVDNLKRWVNYDIFLVDGTLGLEALSWKQVTASNTPTAGSNKVINLSDTTGIAVGDWVTVTLSDWSSFELARVNAVSAGVSITVDSLSSTYGTAPVVTFNSRATSLVKQDGVWVKSGATTRLYLGTIRMYAGNGTTGGKLANDTAQRWIFNAYNATDDSMEAFDVATSWTHASATPRAANGRQSGIDDGGSRVSFVCGLDNAIQVEASYHCVCNNTGGIPEVAVVLDSVSSVPSVGSYVTAAQPLNAAITAIACCATKVTAGFHFIQALEAAHGAATATFYGGSATYSQNVAPWGARSRLRARLFAA